MTCLQELKSKNVIHCDLKPENILMKPGKKAEIKVIDFGASCLVNEKLHAYIQSRFYRAPEVVLGINYNQAIDVWSAGCILAELASGFPLFPAENEMELLVCIAEVKGMPDEKLLERALKKKMFFDRNCFKGFLTSRGKKRTPASKPIENILKGFDGKFVEFVESKS
jgi:dual specificity tyrosine-phosphorylation-regulated kinase 2/3/4